MIERFEWLQSFQFKEISFTEKEILTGNLKLLREIIRQNDKYKQALKEIINSHNIKNKNGYLLTDDAQLKFCKERATKALKHENF